MAGEKSYYVDSLGSIKLSPYRLNESPFAHRYVTDQTIFALYCDRLYPLKHSADEDPLPSYWKLRNGVLLYDVPEMPLEIVGPDAGRLLEKVLVCSVESLGIGRCRYALACNEDGTMVMDGVIMRLGAGALLVCEGQWRVHHLAQGQCHWPGCRSHRPAVAGAPDSRPEVARCAECRHGGRLVS